MAQLLQVTADVAHTNGSKASGVTCSDLWEVTWWVKRQGCGQDIMEVIQSDNLDTQIWGHVTSQTVT